MTQMTQMTQMKVGVVIPAHNEAETLAASLQALASQDWADLDVLLVNDGSTDATSTVVARFPGVRELVNERNLGLAGSINRGLRTLADAGADLGIVLHADCVPQGSAWVKSMIAPFADPAVGAVVSARRLAAAPQGAERFFDAVAPQDYANPTGQDREIDFFRDKCDAYRLSTLKDLGWFDTATFHAAGEDTDLSIRMRTKGLRILQSGTAEVEIGFSSHQRSLSKVFRKALQYGGAQAVLWRRHRFDGLKARSSAAALLALPAVALAFFTPFAWLLLAPALWMLATTTGPGGIPLALAAVPLGAALQASGLPPAQAWAIGILMTALLLPARRALKAARRMRAHGEALLEALQGGLVAFGWWTLTGAGYLSALRRVGSVEKAPV